eukprot:CAMPEP_0195573436 /NCGR_PEP_ID=MMETSP0814-20130614/5333_1 /TAXON_ID=97485 /ORGANISM="Prymnesium parvum, Strain Texoma1" /LENGTH=42 /DNA_ID= /DNA_START= /DNA_END= /DNA_ORIENTATION=
MTKMSRSLNGVNERVHNWCAKHHQQMLQDRVVRLGTGKQSLP